MSATAPAPVPVVVIGAGGMGRAWIATVLGNQAAQLVGVADVLAGAADRAVAEVVPEEHHAGILTGTDALEVARRSGAEAVIDVTIPAAHHAVTADSLHMRLPGAGGEAVRGDPRRGGLARRALRGHREAVHGLPVPAQQPPPA